MVELSFTVAIFLIFTSKLNAIRLKRTIFHITITFQDLAISKLINIPHQH